MGAWATTTAFAIVLLSNLAACSPPRGVKPGDVQVVAQWLVSDSPNAISWGSEARIDRVCEDICFLDGNDIGGGTYNLYLYTQDVPETVKRLVQLEAAHRIPSGLRIGVAKYTDSTHKDWTYEAVYPSTLTDFNISYGAKSKEQTH